MYPLTPVHSDSANSIQQFKQLSEFSDSCLEKWRLSLLTGGKQMQVKHRCLPTNPTNWSTLSLIRLKEGLKLLVPGRAQPHWLQDCVYLRENIEPLMQTLELLAPRHVIWANEIRGVEEVGR